MSILESNQVISTNSSLCSCMWVEIYPPSHLCCKYSILDKTRLTQIAIGISSAMIRAKLLSSLEGEPNCLN